MPIQGRVRKKEDGEAIASSIAKCMQIKVPLISIIIGGGSGGAVALASSNKIIA